MKIRILYWDDHTEDDQPTYRFETHSIESANEDLGRLERLLKSRAIEANYQPV